MEEPFSWVGAVTGRVWIGVFFQAGSPVSESEPQATMRSVYFFLCILYFLIALALIWYLVIISKIKCDD